MAGASTTVAAVCVQHGQRWWHPLSGGRIPMVGGVDGGGERPQRLGKGRGVRQRLEVGGAAHRLRVAAGGDAS